MFHLIIDGNKLEVFKKLHFTQAGLCYDISSNHKNEKPMPRKWIKGACANPIGFFQIYCNFGIIRIDKFFWSSFWNFTPSFLVIRKKSSKRSFLFIMVVTTINNYNRPLFELQRQFIFSLYLDSFHHLPGWSARWWSSNANGTSFQCSDYDVRKGDTIKSPAQLNFHVIFSNSWIFYHVYVQVWGFLSWYALLNSKKNVFIRF